MISLLHGTARPGRWQEICSQWFQNCDNPDDVEYVVVYENKTFPEGMGAQGDSVKIEILCDNIQPTPSPEAAPPAEMVKTVSELKAIADSPSAKKSPASSSGDSSPSRPRGGSAMQTNNAEFDRLRYLFWRYLDWRQRLKVLVDVDALPHTADQPVPQTLERVALEAASKDAGKLYALWEAIMPLLPEEKREPNPFPKGE